MVHITKEEVLKVARLSHIDIHEDEIAKVAAHLQAVLSYAARVGQIVQNPIFGRPGDVFAKAEFANVNVFKPDVVIKTDPEPILEQAPEREGDFFVVPVIIEAGQ